MIMKKILCFCIGLLCCVGLSGCQFKDLGLASEVLSGFQSQLSTIIPENAEIVEIEVEEYYVWSPEYDACYNTLNSKQKEIYKIFYAAAEQMPEGFIKVCEDYDNATRDIHLAYTAMLNDNTEIFWMPATYLIGRTSGIKDNVNIAFSYKSDKNSASYMVSKADRDKKRSELEKKVEKIIDSVSGIEDQYEIEKTFNDYICGNTQYDVNAALANTAYGCLVSGRALCEGYSRAFKLLCNKAGIECDLISGISQGEGHMWNTVNIDGIHSFVDVTWNDSAEDLMYLYFNITEEQLLYDHSFSPLFSTLSSEEICGGKSYNFVERKCTFTGNNYFAKNDLVLDYGYAEKAAEAINLDAGEGLGSTAFLIDNDDLKKNLKTDIAGVLGKIQILTPGVTINQYIFERDVLVVFYVVSD